MEYVTFYDHQVEAMAQFLIQLLKGGIAYEVQNCGDNWKVFLRGY